MTLSASATSRNDAVGGGLDGFVVIVVLVVVVAGKNEGTQNPLVSYTGRVFSLVTLPKLGFFFL
jgi:hypothetical protein